MKQHILIKYAPEIFLKGLNRKVFEDRLIANIRKVLLEEDYKITRDQLRWFIETDMESGERVAQKVAKVFGVMEVDLVDEMELDLDVVAQACVKLLENQPKGTTFKVVTNRANKKFPLNSMEISRELGHILLRDTQGYEVDVRTPQLTIRVEIRSKAYVYRRKIEGAKGMPYGSNGSTMLMLSGGIDSPVAGYLMARRGVTVTGIYYHSHPYTSERAKDKVKTLAGILKESTGRFKLIIPSFTNIQMAIIEKCPEDELTIIMRRFMMRVSEKIAVNEHCSALITGESLGQVASQTLQAIVCTDQAAEMPVFRPLIGMDKIDIIDISRKIDTFDISIQPFEDCCTVFTPKHPRTRPDLQAVLEAERQLDCDALIEECVRNVKLTKITPKT